MNKKITLTFQSKDHLDDEINYALDECYKHVKIFENTLKAIQVKNDESIFGKLVYSIKNNF